MTKEELITQFENMENTIKEHAKICGKERIREVEEKAKKMTKEEVEKLCGWNRKFIDKLVKAIDNNISAESAEIQALMKKYFELSKKFDLPVTKESCFFIKDLLCKDFNVTCKKIHPKLPKYLSKAIEIFAANLKE